jgi:hypothetical protein
MSSSLKISADTSEVKKSILDLGKQLQGLNKGSKFQVFSNDDKKFIKSELNKEMALMKQKLQQNRAEIGKLVEAQDGLVSGSKEELENRKKILDAYKTQAKLAKQLGKTQSMGKSGGDLDKGAGGLLNGLMNFAKMIPGLAAAATIGYAVTKGMAANDQYVKGAPNRNKLKGLGVDEDSFGSADQLGRVGLSEQDMIQRRVDATSQLGRSGTSNETEMKKAGFERAYGLEGGTMTGIATQMRGQKGGEGATDAQMKLQASVMAAGIEDAIGPYLESAVQLLTSINENGTANTDEITALMAQLTKDGHRTPEQLSKTFGDINNGVKGASGESSAFLQQAFARAGIGGGTIGGTKYSMSSGGIMGMDRGALEKRGYNKDLLDNMDTSGMFSGAGKRTGAILDMMKQSGGMKPGDKISGIKDTDKMVGMGNLANNVLGTKGDQGFDALMLMEKVQNKEMTKKQFDEKMKKMQDSNDPAAVRLDKINNTLSGQTEILRTINTNLMESLGKEAVVAGNAITKTDNEGIQGVTNVAGAVNSTGVVEGAGNKAQGMGKWVNGGAMGNGAYNAMDKVKGWFGNSDQDKMNAATSDDAVVALAKKKRDNGTGFKGMSDEDIENKVRASLASQAKDIGKAIGENVRIDGPTVNTRVQLPDGKVTERTSK